jgi:hypothetical protein
MENIVKLVLTVKAVTKDAVDLINIKQLKRKCYNFLENKSIDVVSVALIFLIDIVLTITTKLKR